MTPLFYKLQLNESKIKFEIREDSLRNKEQYFVIPRYILLFYLIVLQILLKL